MTVSQKPYKIKIIPTTISIIEVENELYTEIYHPNKNIINTNHALFQIPK